MVNSRRRHLDVCFGTPCLVHGSRNQTIGIWQWCGPLVLTERTSTSEAYLKRVKRRVKTGSCYLSGMNPVTNPAVGALLLCACILPAFNDEHEFDPFTIAFVCVRPRRV